MVYLESMPAGLGKNMAADSAPAVLPFIKSLNIAGVKSASGLPAPSRLILGAYAFLFYIGCDPATVLFVYLGFIILIVLRHSDISALFMFGRSLVIFAHVGKVLLGIRRTIAGHSLLRSMVVRLSILFTPFAEASEAFLVFLWVFVAPLAEVFVSTSQLDRLLAGDRSLDVFGARLKEAGFDAGN